MERNELINKVKTRMDEVCASGDIIVDVGVENTKPYDSIIDELLDESALEVLLKAPIYRLHVTRATVSPMQDSSDNKIGSITIPDDFVRLVSFKMKEWKQPVTSFAIEGDETARRQSNEHIRGGIAKPVAVLCKTDTGYYAKYYSVKSSHDVGDFLYIKSEKAENITDSQLIEIISWICAGKTLGVLGEPTLSNQCYEEAKGLML